MKKQSKGITLIILIITVILLLIIAGVSIGAIANGGIINKSKDTIDKANERKQEEQNIIEDEIFNEDTDTGIKSTTDPYCKHEFNEWEITTAASGSNPGIASRQCSKCLGYETKEVYEITYTGISTQDTGYPQYFVGGNRIRITFKNTVPSNVSIYLNGTKLDYSDYTYENGTLITKNLEGNVEIRTMEKAYMKALSTGQNFKSSTYLTNIKTVSFVKGIYDKNAIATFDLTYTKEDADTEEDIRITPPGTVIGWIDSDYNLYIGSDFDIYATDLSSAFRNMSGVTKITFDNLNTSENTTLNHTFSGDTLLASIDLSNFNTANVTDMASVFSHDTSLTSLDLKNWNTSQVTTFYSMFYECTNLQNLNIDNFNTSLVENMSGMFEFCANLQRLNLMSFDTINVKNMYVMFNGCEKIEELDLRKFDTSKVTNMHGMFTNCKALTNLNISNFNTSQVTDMQSMFNGCNALSSINVTDFNTSKVTNMSYMFYYCYTLTSLDVSKFNTSNVTNMEHMFCNCQELTSLDLSNFDTSNVTNTDNMFLACIHLNQLKMNNANFTNVTTYTDMFKSALNTISITVKDQAAANFINARLTEAGRTGATVTIATT